VLPWLPHVKRGQASLPSHGEKLVGAAVLSDQHGFDVGEHVVADYDLNVPPLFRVVNDVDALNYLAFELDELNVELLPSVERRPLVDLLRDGLP